MSRTIILPGLSRRRKRPAPRPSDVPQGEALASAGETVASRAFASSPSIIADSEVLRSTTSGVFYGWVMLVLAIAGLVASSPGQTFGVSIFSEAMRSDLGMGHGRMAAAYTLGTLLGALPIAFFGRLMDRFGQRQAMLLVISLFSAACLVTSIVRDWAGLVLAFTLLRMLGAGALSLVSGSMLAFWFDRRLGMVEGIRQTGMAVSMAVIPAANVWLEAHWGWRGAYCFFGIAIWVVLFPAMALLFRNHPEEVGQRIDGDFVAVRLPRTSEACVNPEVDLTLGETLRTVTFWIVAGGTALFGLIHTALFFCIVPIFQERGLSAADVTAMLVALAVCLAVMQIIGGILADRMRASLLLATGAAILSLGVAVLLMSTSITMAMASGGLMGISQGIFFGAVQPLWARYFGRRHLGAIRGMLMTINVAVSSVGPLFAGVMRDAYGDFDVALVTFALVPLPLACLCLLVKPPRRRTPTMVAPGVLLS